MRRPSHNPAWESYPYQTPEEAKRRIRAGDKAAAWAWLSQVGSWPSSDPEIRMVTHMAERLVGVSPGGTRLNPDYRGGTLVGLEPGEVFAKVTSHRGFSRVAQILGRKPQTFASLRRRVPAATYHFIVGEDEFRRIQSITGVSRARFSAKDEWFLPMSHRLEVPNPDLGLTTTGKLTAVGLGLLGAFGIVMGVRARRVADQDLLLSAQAVINPGARDTFG